jgi:hypothetical protein
LGRCVLGDSRPAGGNRVEELGHPWARRTTIPEQQHKSPLMES